MDQLAEHERCFRRADLPLFIEDRPAREDIFNRAAPFLGIVFVGEMLGAGNSTGPGGRTCLRWLAAWRS
jgi:hypothetical protein